MLKNLALLFPLASIAGASANPGNAISRDVSYLVERPSLGSGTYFSSGSDQNVLCQAMGYERAAVGSMSSEAHTDADGALISIDEFGELSGSSIDERVKNIVCMNWILPPARKAHRVYRPSHPQSKALLTTASDVNGICGIAGFQSGIPQTIASATNASGPRITVDASGKVTDGAPEGTPFVESLVCLSKVPSPILELEPYFQYAFRSSASRWVYSLSLRMKLDPAYVHTAPDTWFDLPFQLSASLRSGSVDERDLSSTRDMPFAFFATLKKYENSTSVYVLGVHVKPYQTPRGNLTLRLGTVGNPLTTLSIPLPEKEIR